MGSYPVTVTMGLQCPNNCFEFQAPTYDLKVVGPNPLTYVLKVVGLNPIAVMY